MCGCELGVELYRFFQYFPGLASGVSVEAAFLHQEDSVKILRSESSRPQLDCLHHFFVGFLNFMPPVVVETESLVHEGRFGVVLERLFAPGPGLPHADWMREKIAPKTHGFPRCYAPTVIT